MKRYGDGGDDNNEGGSFSPTPVKQQPDNEQSSSSSSSSSSSPSDSRSVSRQSSKENVTTTTTKATAATSAAAKTETPPTRKSVTAVPVSNGFGSSIVYRPGGAGASAGGSAAARAPNGGAAAAAGGLVSEAPQTVPPEDTEDPERPDDLLMGVYKECRFHDPEVESEALNAYVEMRGIPIDGLDTERRVEPEGMVQRRAPLNPLNSPLVAKVMNKKKEKRQKIEDPALSENSIRGKLTITFTTTAILLFVFLQSLCYNKSSVGNWIESTKVNGMLGPAPQTLYDLGGLSSNEMRRGQVWRLFWAMWMHSGWIHLLLNLGSQLQFLWMIEPDWGAFRTLCLFFISGVSGNLFSSCMDPCSTTVGSSGAMFGLMGAMVPYCIEYWKSIPRPGLILVFSLVVALISFLTGFTGSTDNWAHLGGIYGGFFFGLLTITKITAWEGWCPCGSSKNASDGASTAGDDDLRQRKKIVKRNMVARFFQQHVCTGCKCGARETAARALGFSALLIWWVVFFVVLLKNYEFQPPGHITYTKIQKCCCCYYADAADTAEFWTCNYCDAAVSSTATWDSLCEARDNVAAAEKAFEVELLLRLSSQRSNNNATTVAINYIDDSAAFVLKNNAVRLSSPTVSAWVSQQLSGEGPEGPRKKASAPLSKELHRLLETMEAYESQAFPTTSLFNPVGGASWPDFWAEWQKHVAAANRRPHKKH